MKNTKYFELSDPDASLAYYIMKIVIARCAGEATDPDTERDWTEYKNVTVSVVRLAKNKPEVEENYNVVSNNIFNFTVKELAKDAEPDNYNDKISAIGAAVRKLPIRRCSSRFFLKVDIDG